MASLEREILPDYRVRLFLSVDLVGSTAYKAAEGNAPSQDKASQPQWIKILRDFYVQFPALLESQFLSEADGQHPEGHPKVWKTVGDELIFCCRVFDTDHLTTCMNTFLKVLRHYGRDLKAAVPRLDVKGAAWLAAFPWPNFTIPVESQTADQPTEQIEVLADRNPRGFDFLGNGIDCGFRVASRSAFDKCAVSLELASFLADAAEKSSFIGTFSHFELCVLKGVLRERPYPIVFVDTERSRSRRLVRHHERALSGLKAPSPIEVNVYLQHFMEDEQIEMLALPAQGDPVPSPPESYLLFKENWIRDLTEMQQRRALEEEAEQQEANVGEQDIPEDVKSFLETADRAANTEDDD